MGLPWLRILDAALGVGDLVRARKRFTGEAESQQLAAGPGALGGIEARLAGVVVAALREAFDRDTRRLELEREQVENERRRAERALQLELIRQAGDREIGRQRLLAGLAVASWIGTLFFSARLIGGAMTARWLLGGGWILLLAAVASSFTAQSTIAQTLQRAGDDPALTSTTSITGTAGQMAPWLIVSGLALVGLAVLVS